MQSKTILVFGREGQLATALREARLPPEYTLVARGRTDCDITSEGSIRAAIDACKPALVINAAAYTAVDKAEADRDAALALNARAPGIMANCCAHANAPLIHISSDYVFNGETGAPYRATDSQDPVNFYGETKALGESAVLNSGARAAIVRTSWVFSGMGANFVSTMLRLAKDRQEIGVVDDQTGRPTAAEDLASACLDLGSRLTARRGTGGGYLHFANSGDVTWRKFAEAVMSEAAGQGAKIARIRPITTEDYPTPAKRPRDSRLDTSRIEVVLGAAAPSWRAPLARAVSRLLAN